LEAPGVTGSFGGTPPTRLVVKNPPLKGAISPPDDGRRDAVAL
jgi:hypothetical protein